jgi:hypothetical protein
VVTLETIEVAVDLGAQVVHDRLADLGRQPGLRDAQRAGHHGHADHAADEPGQQRRVAVGQRGVEDRAQEERRHHRNPCREHDQPEDGGQPAPVRAEQSRDSHGRECSQIVERLNYYGKHPAAGFATVPAVE